MTNPNFSCWGFIIDTDSYAGSFESEMCSYLTGAVGEHDDPSAIDEYEDYSLFKDEIVAVMSENGAYYYASIYLTEGYSKNKKHFYNSVCIFFRKKPTKKQISFMKEKVKTFKYKSFKKVLGFKLIQFKVTKKVFTI